jgi:hypothetical protein
MVALRCSPHRRLDSCILFAITSLLGWACTPESVPSAGFSSNAGNAALAGWGGGFGSMPGTGVAGAAGFSPRTDVAGRSGATGIAGFSGSVGNLGNVAGDRAMSPVSSNAGAQAQGAAGSPAILAAGAGGSAAGASGASKASSGCTGSTFALCEDFESGLLNTQLWKIVAKKGTVTLDTTRGARGSHSSMHVHIDSGSDTTVGLTETKTFPTLKAGLSARAFIYIPSTNTASLFMGDRHTRLIYAQGSSPAGEYALGIWNGGLIQNHYSKSDDSVDTKMLPPFDVWFCLEYELDSASGTVKAYLEDTEITALRHSGWPAANIDTLMFGADRYGNFPEAEELWFDDLVVDSAHIGCSW